MHFKNIAAKCKIFKVCLTILGHYALKGLENPPLCHTEAFCNEKSKEAFADIA